VGGRVAPGDEQRMTWVDLGKRSFKFGDALCHLRWADAALCVAGSMRQADVVAVEDCPTA